MRKRGVIILLCLLLWECRKDFNPITDSLMCPMTFNFVTSHLFDTVLAERDGVFKIGDSSDIPEGYELRIVSYCYDSKNTLLRTDEVYSDELADLKLKVPYVFRSEQYRFVFVADFVKNGSSYWYPLSMSQLSSAYLRRSNNNPVEKAQFAYRGMWEGIPMQQVIDIELIPITYNCFCIFHNLEDLDKIEISLGYCNSVHLCDDSYDETVYRHSLTQIFPDKDIIIPLVLTDKDDNLSISVNRKYYSDKDTLAGRFNNPLKAPFVLTLDGVTLNYNIDVYE